MSAGLELKDDATREDVDAMVKQVMEERAELTGKQADNDDAGGSKKTDVGDDDDAAGKGAAAGRDTAGGEDSGEEEEDGQSQDWLTDEVRAELPRWVSDEDLSGFSSRDELDRALVLLDRAALKAGRDAGKTDDEGQKADDAGQRGKENDQETKGSQDGKVRKQQERETATHEIDLDLSEFDEDLGKKVKGALTGLRDHYESRLKALDERFTAIEAEEQVRSTKAVEAQFDALVDSLGHADLFGTSGEESEKQLEARSKLFDEHHVYLTGLKALGREARMDKASVSRVMRMAFADHISKQEQKNLTKRITKQSNMRMGVGAERPAEQSFKGPLKQHPDVQRAYKQLRESRGEE
jgi:hypothetical protein